jgi:hypothetical protein
MITRRKMLIPILLLLFAVLIGACGGQADEEMTAESIAMDSADFAAGEAYYNEMEAMEEEMALPSEPKFDSDGVAANQAPTQRLIIKDGNITLEVDDTEITVDSATDIITSMGGYIVSQNMYTSSDQIFANIRFGVPSEQFETAMRQLGTLGEVLGESASGQDVTEEYFDLGSRLENLEATQEQLRIFLEEAENTEEALMVHRELRQIEGEINQITGRMEFLSDRASFSSISMEIRPIFTPTVSEPDEWRPGYTIENAWSQFITFTQQILDLLIYFGIVCVPWLLVVGVVAFVLWRIVKRIRRRRQDSEPEMAAEQPDIDADDA